MRKDNAGSGENGPHKRRRDSEGSNGMNMLPLRSLQLMIPLKPLSPEEIQVVKDYRIFLQRSLKKVKIDLFTIIYPIILVHRIKALQVHEMRKN